jgi:hypothetical protein
MILVSIQPFAPKKLFALAATVACLSTASCFADAMYLSAKPAPATPKARQAQPAQRAISNAAATQPFSIVSHWNAEIRDAAFAYTGECKTVQSLLTMEAR